MSVTPNHRLVCAILERAFMDLSRPENGIRKDAIRWIFSSRTTEFSFLWAIDVLGLNCTPRKIREIALQVIKLNEENKQ
jgi:hypothetical protein